jgi:CDP-diacylglycerol--serine O-phosphatidyltransferase
LKPTHNPSAADAAAAKPRPRRLRRGAYLLPSLFTVANIVFGFLAIVRGYRGDFREATVFLLIAATVDALDGRVARLMGTESEFGREYDSLADVVTFGAAPALLAYFWGLEDLGRASWLPSLFFLVCCATRLARFNVQAKVVDSKSFVGLPTPAAAGGVGSILFFAPTPWVKPWTLPLLTVALIGLGLLMVSTFRYPSFKKVDLRQRRSYRAMLPLALLILTVALHPPAFFLVATATYALWGPVAWLWGLVTRKPSPPPTSENASS